MSVRQRVSIARAMVLNPSYIVADEPVSMIDASSRAEILSLLDELQAEHQLTFLYITHDLATAYYISDRIMVMEKGVVVESGDARTVLDDPQHPYTRRLKASVLSAEPPGTAQARDDPPEPRSALT